jgi:hypothetical protein
MAVNIIVKLKTVVFFPGDIFSCVVETTHLGTNPDFERTDEVTLSWLAIQVHGHCAVDTAWIKLPSNSHTKSSIVLPEGSFVPKLGDGGNYLFCTPPTVLLKDLKLKPGESKFVFFTCFLPPDLPPSYNGTTVKYVYGVTVAARKSPKSQTQMVKVPFRVLNPASGLKRTIFNVDSQFEYNIVIKEIKPGFVEKGREASRDFLPQEKNMKKTINALYEKGAVPVSININKNESLIVKFTVNRTVFQLGDDIKGIFNFCDSKSACYQVSVTLDYEEIVEPKVLRAGRSQRIVRNTVNEFHEYTHNTLKTSFFFSLPPDAPQYFSTDLVSVKWMLNFRFLVLAKNPLHSGNVKGDVVEVLEWQYPLKVLIVENSENYLSANLMTNVCNKSLTL